MITVGRCNEQTHSMIDSAFSENSSMAASLNDNKSRHIFQNTQMTMHNHNSSMTHPLQ